MGSPCDAGGGAVFHRRGCDEVADRVERLAGFWKAGSHVAVTASGIGWPTWIGIEFKAGTILGGSIMGYQRHRRIAVAIVAAFAALLCVEAARGNSVPIVNIDPSTQIQSPPGPGQYFGFNESHGDGMVGWSFSLLQPITVSQVGWYDDGQAGLSRSFQVGLWWGPTPSATQLLGTPTAGILIPGGTQATLDGVWRVIDLPTPLDLQPGFYVLGGLDSATTPDVIKYALMQGHESDPSLTGSRLTIGAFFYATGADAPGFHRPNLFYLADGLELGPMLFTNVPEASTLSLLGVGVISLLLSIWLKSAKSAG